MPRTDQYSRKRFYLMQAAMWVILAASVGVAALVDARKQRALQTQLGETVIID